MASENKSNHAGMKEHPLYIPKGVTAILLTWYIYNDLAQGVGSGDESSGFEMCHLK